MKIIALCLSIGLLTAPVSVRGATLQQRATFDASRHERHGYVGGHLMGLAALAQSTDYQTGYLGRFGGGIGLFGGMRLGPYLALEGNWTFSLHDGAWGTGQGPGVEVESLYIMTVTADARVYLPTRTLMEPYLQGGVGFALSGAIHLPGDPERPQEGDLFAKGFTFTAGGGLDLWVSRHVCMGGRVLYRGFALGEPDLEPLALSARNFVSSISVDAFASIHF